MNGKMMKLKVMFSTLATVALLTTGTPAMAAKPAPRPQPGEVIAVLGFDADWTQNMPNGWVFPADCQTEAHLAGPNEVAVVNMNGFVAPVGASSDFLQMRVAVSIDGWPFEQTSLHSTLDGMSDGAAHVGITKTIPLENGATYVFAPQFGTGSPLTVGFATCQGTVMVVRLPY